MRAGDEQMREKKLELMRENKRGRYYMQKRTGRNEKKR